MYDIFIKFHLINNCTLLAFMNIAISIELTHLYESNPLQYSNNLYSTIRINAQFVFSLQCIYNFCFVISLHPATDYCFPSLCIITSHLSAHHVILFLLILY